MNEVFVKKFAVKFLSDTSFSDLKQALEEGNAENAFRAAHTLKEICLNLEFDGLYKASYELTEKLRGRVIEGSDELFSEVEKQYNKTIDALSGIE